MKGSKPSEWVLRARSSHGGGAAAVRWAAALWGLLALAGAADASDGILEINQACAVSSGCFPGDSAGFPVEITEPGSYRLTGNLDIRGLPSPENTTVIALKAGDVTIDLAGFAILGAAVCSGTPTTCSGAGSGVGILAALADDLGNIRVENGTIRGMGSNGIELESTGFRTGYQVDRVRCLSNAARGIRFRAVGNSSIRDSVADQNGTFGISVIGGGGLIEKSVVSRNGGNGVNASGYLVRGNSISNNGLSGLVFASGYVSNVFSENSPDVGGGNIQLGSNLCSGVLCP